MKTVLKLCNLSFYAYHGVLPKEKYVGSCYNVNLIMEADLSVACKTDNVYDTVSYAEVYDVVKSEMHVPSQLIEHVCLRIHKKVKEMFPQIINLEVRLAKLRPPVNGEVEKAEIVISG